MKKLAVLLFLGCNFLYSKPPVWSKTGHRTIGLVAEQHLKAKTKRALKKLLNGQSLAAVSTFADEIKADSTFRKFSAWHYVNIPPGQKYGEEPPSRYGDLIVGIEKCIAVAQDKESRAEDRVFYLKMLIHLIGDLHQPMHVGKLEDRGGNDIQIQWFDRGTNLHRLWDANMIDDYGMSYTELADKLPKISKKQIKAIQKGDVLDWVDESRDIADKVYESVEVGEKLYYRYRYVWWGTVENQLLKGGVRLAKVLNDLF
ncbi:S1/P1 nuclease [Poritiphilus flavus]|uniref:S1/P1 Nuclease n=1 Tax=Poritiphilus flavus TaxID=2697053 RepID=A0A6L9EAR6_9FLAO|nr:S1/P1 nuclease [Poritiphilus flavus]NAS11836.1 S1/P1 Nuclease [Poritiphilus flavus]